MVVDGPTGNCALDFAERAAQGTPATMTEIAAGFGISPRMLHRIAARARALLAADPRTRVLLDNL